MRFREVAHTSMLTGPWPAQAKPPEQVNNFWRQPRPVVAAAEPVAVVEDESAATVIAARSIQRPCWMHPRDA